MKAIYKITDTINNKIYIGQSNNPQHRWISHKSHARNNEYIGVSALYDAIRAHGEENFIFEIIGWYEDYNEKEKYYIKLYNSMIPNGYNYSQKLIDNIIDDLLSHKYTQKEIEIKYNVNQQLITSINRGVTYRRPGLQYPIIKTSKYHCDNDTLNKIIYLLKYSTCTCAEIGQYFGFDTSAIKAINAGRNHHLNNIQYPIRTFRGKSNSQSVEAILAKRSTETIDTSLEM